ncbi:hypothetical protein CEXT_704841 [Caerostris extrusa]|uniref:Uncharacterized protein n=1 Tax=Caerostris extrusa TaxID=172846 RepID=A0AAV4VXJ0_CAEEX|nr:hypothetical protein CEXT_704841 [Caerostris extrusa]
MSREAWEKVPLKEDNQLDDIERDLTFKECIGVAVDGCLKERAWLKQLGSVELVKSAEKETTRENDQDKRNI